MGKTEKEISPTAEVKSEVVIFGEILFDYFPGGKRVLGGAPFNVAWHLKGLSGDPLIVSAVGDDEDGKEILSRMNSWGLDREGIAVHQHLSTGVVRITFKGDEPSYEIEEPKAWDEIIVGNRVAEKLIYHGSLGLRSIHNEKALEALCRQSSAKRFLDLNVRPPYYDFKKIEKWFYDLAWLKLNKDEFFGLIGKGDDTVVGMRDAIDQLRRKYRIENVLLTLGSEGAVLRGAYGDADVIPAPKPEVFKDAVGAGDSLTAVVIDGYLKGKGAQEVLESASRFASRICGLEGATTDNQTFYKV